MFGVLFDTNIMIDWLRSYRHSRPKSERQKYLTLAACKFLQPLITQKIHICLSCHTVKELLQYPHISKQEEDRILNLLPKAFEIIDTTHEIAKVAGLLARQSHEYRNHHIEDCYIAATAITYKIPLYTRNPADYSYVQHEDLIIKVPYTFNSV